MTQEISTSAWNEFGTALKLAKSDTNREWRAGVGASVLLYAALIFMASLPCQAQSMSGESPSLECLGATWFWTHRNQAGVAQGLTIAMFSATIALAVAAVLLTPVVSSRQAWGEIARGNLVMATRLMGCIASSSALFWLFDELVAWLDLFSARNGSDLIPLIHPLTLAIAIAVMLLSPFIGAALQHGASVRLDNIDLTQERLTKMRHWRHRSRYRLYRNLSLVTCLALLLLTVAVVATAEMLVTSASESMARTHESMPVEILAPAALLAGWCLLVTLSSGFLAGYSPGQSAWVPAVAAGTAVLMVSTSLAALLAALLPVWAAILLAVPVAIFPAACAAAVAVARSAARRRWRISFGSFHDRENRRLKSAYAQNVEALSRIRRQDEA